MSTKNEIIAEVNNSNQAMQIFNNEKFGEIRTMGDANNPLFCLTDLCKALGLERRDVKDRLDDEVVSTHPIADSLGRMQETTFVNEVGLYQVIFQSKKEEAKEFTKWVTSEVLPMIRKTGMYLTEDTKEKLNNSNDEAIKELIAKYDEVKEELKAIQPAKQFYNNMVDTNGDMLIRDFAKLFNIQGNELKVRDVYKWFRDNKFTMKNNLPYEMQRRKGLMTVKLGKDRYGRLTKTTLITEKGVKYYHDLIVANLLIE